MSDWTDVTKPLKNEVARAVRQAAQALPLRFDDVLADEVLTWEATEVSPLVMQLRVRTRTNGTHYYTIKVSESW